MTLVLSYDKIQTGEIWPMTKKVPFAESEKYLHSFFGRNEHIDPEKCWSLDAVSICFDVAICMALMKKTKEILTAQQYKPQWKMR